MTNINIGSVVKVNHPITCLNPTEYFEIVDMQYDLSLNRCAVRGKDTCWFGVTMIVDVKESENV